MTSGIIGNGVYSFAEAAQLTSVSYRRLRAWFCGEEAGGSVLIGGDYSSQAKGGMISFHDLIDALVVARLRDHGLSLQYLRKVHAALHAEFEIDHPFCWKKLLTDGRRIFVHAADEMGEQRLRELLTRQQAFPQILLPVLKKIEYDPTSLLARRWNVAHGVVIDPRCQRGKPIVESVGIPTAVLAHAYAANGNDTRVVADWYDVQLRDVEAAVAFEAGISGAAA